MKEMTLGIPTAHQRQTAYPRYGAVALCLLCIWAGVACGAEQRSANEVLHLALQGRSWLRSVYATASMRITDREQKFTLGIKTEIYAQKPHNLRIQASKLMGRMDVFDAVVLGEKVAVYVPRKKTLYHGTLQDLESAEMRFHPEEIARQMLRPDVHLLMRSWRHGPTPPAKRSRRQSKNTLVLLENAPPGRPFWRVTVEDGSYRLLQVEEVSPAGVPLMVKTYSKYRLLGAKDGPPELDDTGQAFPFRVVLQWPQKRRTIKITFKDVLPDPPLGAEAFSLAYNPATTTLKPLNAVEIESDDDSANDNVETTTR